MLPSTAQRFVKLHQALVLAAAGLGKSELGFKERPLPVENLEVGSDASAITNEGGVNRILQVFDGCFLSDADLMKFLVTDQRIRDIAKGELDNLLVSEQFLPMLRLSQFQIAPQRSAGKNRLANLGAVGPDSGLGRLESGEQSAPAESASAAAGK